MSTDSDPEYVESLLSTNSSHSPPKTDDFPSQNSTHQNPSISIASNILTPGHSPTNHDQPPRYIFDLPVDSESETEYHDGQQEEEEDEHEEEAMEVAAPVENGDSGPDSPDDSDQVRNVMFN